MEFRPERPKVITFVALILFLSSCGGGGSSPGSMAEAVGLSKSVVPESMPAPAAAPALVKGYYVNFETGSDANDGKSPAKAWKHAPGDPSATDVADSTRLVAGDRLIFAANVQYRGEIVADYQGTAASPIIIEGETPARTAVIDGTSLSAEGARCISQTACGGVPNWQSLSVARFAESVPSNAILYSGSRVMFPAQWPDPEKLFYNDEVNNLADVNGVDVQRGRVPLPSQMSRSLAALENLRVAVWVRPNKIEERAVTRVDQDFAYFDSAGLDPYLDRMDKFALRGHSALLSKTGEFAILPDRRTVVYASDGTSGRVVASTGRGGIDLSGARNVIVRNLTFQNMSDIEGNIRSGMPIWIMRAAAENITIQDNTFQDLYLRNGQGAITAINTRGLTISGNTIRTIVEGSGMRLSQSTDVRVEGNTIEQIGRTGIMFMNNADSTIVRNKVRDALGIHGNGISVYLGNLRTKVIANTVVEAYQPMTIKGNSALQPAATDLYVANNLFVTNADSLGAFVSWGAGGHNIKLYNNVLLGASKGSLRLHTGDRNLTVQRNVIDGIVYNEAYASDWSITNNTFRLLGVFQNRITPADTVAAALPFATSRNGSEPTNLQQFCPYVTERYDFTIFGRSYNRNVGADFTCT